MPIYEYRCNACEQIFEEWQNSFDDKHPDCPVCGGSAERILSNTTFVLKGGGWYVSEYGRNSASGSSCEHTAHGDNGDGTKPAEAAATTEKNSAGTNAEAPATAAKTADTTSAAASAGAAKAAGSVAAPSSSSAA